MKDFKQEVLEMLSSNKDRWQELKGKEYDTTHENFIDDVLLVYEWVIKDIEKM